VQVDEEEAVMNSRFTVKGALIRAAVVIAVLFASVGTARAAPMMNPDLTVYGVPLTWNGTVFSSSCADCVMSWTTQAGDFGGLSLSGAFALDWNGSTGAFAVIDNDPLSDSGILGTLLAGNVTSFFGGAGLFWATVGLTTTNLGLGDQVSVSLSSFDFVNGAGTADVDIAPSPIPEPGTFALLGLGGTLMALRRRRRASRTGADRT
jgi:hypothetical protein